MTRIGNSTASQTAGPELQSGRLEKHEKLQPDGNEKSRHRKSVDKTKPQDTKTQGVKFEQKIAQAINKARLATEGEGSQTLLVILHPAGQLNAGAHSAIPSGLPQSASGVPASTRRVEWVESLANRIECAFQAGTRTGVNNITINLDLAAHELGGIRGVEISMSPSALDVVLTRMEGQATVEYLAATHALAERLQDRFSRRIIRIHEVAIQQKRTSAQGLEEISQILGKPEQMR